ncbi:CCA tRNA nucleotidyltransferase [Clostridium sediminicola]|uniref:CCA tRNA nucleotidyltransferase n=1 Tax=Clostridium sediminicola TaxID=3114879 RepID=UPI0031F24653
MGIKNYLSSEELIVVNYVCEICKELSIKAYLVGGVVRDYLLGRRFKDIDICIESDPIIVIEEMQGKGFINKYNYYENFRTSTIQFKNGVEIDLICTRKEEYIENGSLPSVIKSTIEEDLFRRDFTINALAYDLIDNRIIDIYNGVSSIYRKEITKIHANSYFEDPTRIFRAIKYSNRYDFSIMDRAEIQSVVNKGIQNMISHDRIMKEIISLCTEKECVKNLYTVSMFNIIKLDMKKLFLENSLYDNNKIEHKIASIFYALSDEEDKKIFISNSVLSKEIRIAFRNHNLILQRLEDMMNKGADNFSIYTIFKNLNPIEMLLINYEHKYKYIITNYKNNLSSMKLNTKLLDDKVKTIENKKKLGKMMKKIVELKLNTLIEIEKTYQKRIF